MQTNFLIELAKRTYYNNDNNNNNFLTNNENTEMKTSEEI